MKKPRKQNNLHVILHNLVIVKASGNDRYFWGRETKIVKQLVKKYGEDFMLWVTPPEGYRVASMVFFKTREGENYLNGKHFEYKCQNAVQTKDIPVVLSQEKVGEDVKIEPRKPRTLKDFLNYYGKND
jgi:hypothetical protein